MKNKTSTFIPSMAAVFLGLVMIAAAFSKVGDMHLFVRQIKAYGLVADHTFILWSAWLLTGFEFGLGAALVARYRLTLSLPSFMAVMALFMAATLYAWAAGTAEDCGCFGSWVKRTPAQAVTEDAVLVLVSIYGFWARGKPDQKQIWRAALVALAALAGLAYPLASGFAPWEKPLAPVVQPGQQAGGPAAVFQVNLANGQTLEIKGSRLVALMDTDCDHCQGAVPILNVIHAEPDLPEVAALCVNDDEQVAEFRENFLPEYPLYQVKSSDFWRLVGEAEPPRYLLIKNGAVIADWELDAPGPGDVAEKLEAGR